MLKQQKFNMIVCEFANDVITIENQCENIFNESTTHNEIISFLGEQNLLKYNAFTNEHIFKFNEELAHELMIYARCKMTHNLSILFNIEEADFEFAMYEDFSSSHFEIMFNDFDEYNKHFN